MFFKTLLILMVVATSNAKADTVICGNTTIETSGPITCNTSFQQPPPPAPTPNNQPPKCGSYTVQSNGSITCNGQRING